MENSTSLNEIMKKLLTETELKLKIKSDKMINKTNNERRTFTGVFDRVLKNGLRSSEEKILLIDIRDSENDIVSTHQCFNINFENMILLYESKKGDVISFDARFIAPTEDGEEFIFKYPSKFTVKKREGVCCIQMDEIYKKINDAEFKNCIEHIEELEAKREYVGAEIDHYVKRFEIIEDANNENEPVMPEVYFAFLGLQVYFENDELSDELIDKIEIMNERFNDLKHIMRYEDYNYEVSKIEQDFKILYFDCMNDIDLDCIQEIRNKHKPNQARISECIIPSNDIENDKKSCQDCDNKNHCITVNPDLAAVIQKSKNENGKYIFSKDDVVFLNTNYPEVLVYSSTESQAVEYFIN